MAGTYNTVQTNFALTMFSNFGLGQKGTPDQIGAAVAPLIDQYLATYAPQMGTWTRVWGPAVGQVPGSTVADNVMFVASNGANQLVVSIAGTNPGSAFDVVVEDLFVVLQVPWLWGSDAGKIAFGTLSGLALLQVITPGASLPGAGKTIQNFLKGAVTAATTITTCGHSLGGALSPALALWLKDTQSAWDTDGNATILCQPSAGPTPGDGDFATYYDASLGSQTTRVHNAIDMVPHAWNETDLSAIPTLYVPNIEPDAEIYAIDIIAGLAAAGGNYTQVNASTPALPGTVNTTLVNPQWSPLQNFLVQALYQHMDAYALLLNMPDFLPVMEELRKLLAGASVAAAVARHQQLATVVHT